VIYNL